MHRHYEGWSSLLRLKCYSHLNGIFLETSRIMVGQISGYHCLDPKVNHLSGILGNSALGLFNECYCTMDISPRSLLGICLYYSRCVTSCKGFKVTSFPENSKINPHYWRHELAIESQILGYGISSRVQKSVWVACVLDAHSSPFPHQDKSSRWHGGGGRVEVFSQVCPQSAKLSLSLSPYPNLSKTMPLVNVSCFSWKLLDSCKTSIWLKIIASMDFQDVLKNSISRLLLPKCFHSHSLNWMTL